MCVTGRPGPSRAWPSREMRSWISASDVHSSAASITNTFEKSELKPLKRSQKKHFHLTAKKHFLGLEGRDSRKYWWSSHLWCRGSCWQADKQMLQINIMWTIHMLVRERGRSSEASNILHVYSLRATWDSFLQAHRVSTETVIRVKSRSRMLPRE